MFYGGIENEMIEDMKITSAVSMELYIEWAEWSHKRIKY